LTTYESGDLLNEFLTSKEMVGVMASLEVGVDV
jgi:hypothetical protein